MSWRIAEIFGPTIQGEGRLVGMPCHFVRFGGCDFRCSWCDTPHAVIPELVAQLPKMDEWGIISALNKLDEGDTISPNWVVLSGGNPALFNLRPLIHLLHTRSQKVILETQGSVYREWFTQVDDLCFSPKPPSSGNVTDLVKLQEMIARLVIAGAPRPYLKIPVFSTDDLDYVEVTHKTFPDLELFISIGNDDPYLPTVSNPNPPPKPPHPEALMASEIVMENFRGMLYKVQERQSLADARIFPQQHVLLWGNERGH